MAVPIGSLWLALALCCCMSAHAADIKVLDVDRKGFAVIGVVGELLPDDGRIFADVAARFRRGGVVFHSPGGAVIAGLQIGQVIRLRRFATFSADDMLCASACAVAWLAGRPRMMQPASHIGFHAAYDGKTREQSGVGNALVGAYLNRLGLSDAAVVYVTRTRPDDIAWLTPADARELGLAVTVLPASPATRPQPPPAPRPPAAGPAAIDPSPALPTSHSVPGGFPSLVAPEPPPAVAASLDEQAQDFAQDYFAHWSEANGQALAFFADAYAPSVVFYGDPLDQDAVVRKKHEYAMRWPVRVYTARPASLRSFCNPARRICVVTGIVDWDCRAAGGTAHSTGAAHFSLTVALGDDATGDDAKRDGSHKILAESGSVIERSGG